MTFALNCSNHIQRNKGICDSSVLLNQFIHVCSFCVMTLHPNGDSTLSSDIRGVWGIADFFHITTMTLLKRLHPRSPPHTQSLCLLTAPALLLVSTGTARPVMEWIDLPTPSVMPTAQWQECTDWWDECPHMTIKPHKSAPGGPPKSTPWMHCMYGWKHMPNGHICKTESPKMVSKKLCKSNVGVQLCSTVILKERIWFTKARCAVY